MATSSFREQKTGRHFSMSAGSLFYDNIILAEHSIVYAIFTAMQCAAAMNLFDELHIVVAGSGLGCVVDHIDHGLGFAGAFGANDQFNHKK